jgi:hypothetical protein
MFKVMWLLKRKAGTSMDDLIHYYENIHSKIGERFAKVTAVKYTRRYLHPIVDPIPATRGSCEPEFDVAMEMWFESRAEWDRLLEISSPEAVSRMIVDDENRFLDRTRRRVFIIEEHESELG